VLESEDLLDGCQIIDHPNRPLRHGTIPRRRWGPAGFHLLARVHAAYIRSMKILYGVVGEGMGHAIRSRVVLDHLLATGHEV